MLRAALVLALLPGCSTVLGIEEYPYAAEDAAVVDAPADSPSECDTCMAGGCGAAESACRADPGCLSVLRCVSGCPLNDIMCRDGCETGDEAVATGALFRAVDGCRRTKCVRQCVGQQGFGAAVGPGCGCIDTECAKELGACIQSSAAGPAAVGDCERIGACTTRLGSNPAAASGCFNKHVAGAPEFLELRKCFISRCSTCPLFAGGAYSCVGNYVYDKPQPGPIPLRMLVGTLGFGLVVIPNATVTACEQSMCARCDRGGPFVARGITDANGVVTLELPVAAEGFRGCYHIAGGPGFVDTLWYSGRPIVAPESVEVRLIFRTELLKAGFDVTGTTHAPGYGVLGFIANDCVNTPSSGVRVELDGQDDKLRCGYVIESLPDLEAKATGITGFGVFANVKGDAITTIRSFRGASEVGESRAWVRADPGVGGVAQLITVVSLLPRTR